MNLWFFEDGGVDEETGRGQRGHGPVQDGDLLAFRSFSQQVS
jgi:hypothetical protein